MITARCESVIIQGLCIGRIRAFHHRHQIIAKFLAERICQRIQSRILQIILHIERRRHNNQRFNIPCCNQLIQHHLVARMGLQPVVFIIPGSMHEVKNVVLFCFIIPVREIHERPFLHVPAIRCVSPG